MAGALIFIQIIQNVMFGRSFPRIPNYCFKEYTNAVKQRKGGIYIFAEGKHPDHFIAEDDTDFDVNDWYHFI